MHGQTVVFANSEIMDAREAKAATEEFFVRIFVMWEAQKGFCAAQELAADSDMDDHEASDSDISDIGQGVIEVRIRPRRSVMNARQWEGLQARPGPTMDILFSKANLDEKVKAQRILAPSSYLCFHILFQGSLEEFKNPFRDLFPLKTSFDVKQWDITAIGPVAVQEHKRGRQEYDGRHHCLDRRNCDGDPDAEGQGSDGSRHLCRSAWRVQQCRGRSRSAKRSPRRAASAATRSPRRSATG